MSSEGTDCRGKTNTMFDAKKNGRGLSILTLLTAAWLLPGCASEPDYSESLPRFATAAEAFEAIVTALRNDDLATAATILGPASQDVLYSGDEIADRNGRQEFVALYDQRNSIEDSDVGVILHVGEVDWPMPIPAVEDARGWYLDCEEGVQELLDRRVGRNELATIQACLAYVDAQDDYHEKDRDGDGLLEYAQFILSRVGKRDGLYWPNEPGEEPSPLGAFAAEASREGYDPRRPEVDSPRPYHGYFYRILTSQGPSAPGGAYDYMANGSMIGGCALIAHPADHGVSGVMTFMVSHEGRVYQKDLGADTESAASAIVSFDPGEGWEIVESEQ